MLPDFLRHLTSQGLEERPQKQHREVSDLISLISSPSPHLNRVVLSLSAAIHGKGLSLFDHLLDNNQDEKGEGYRSILKLGDSMLTIPVYDTSLLTLIATHANPVMRGPRELKRNCNSVSCACTTVALT